MNSIKIQPLSIPILFLSLLLSGCSLPSNITIGSPHPGLVLESLQNTDHQIFAALLNTTKNQLEIIENPVQKTASNIQEIHQQFHSLLSFNGGFYSENFHPSGLLISQGKELYPLMKADLLDGIFTIDQKHQAKLYQYEAFKKAYPQLQLDFAIQNGPILIDEKGEIAISNKSSKKANRTALGITKDGQVVVIIDRETILDSDKAPTLYQFADLIKTSTELKDLGIHSVLNLDGGPSTGFAFDDQYYPELEKVQNVIIIKPLQSG